MNIQAETTYIYKLCLNPRPYLRSADETTGSSSPNEYIFANVSQGCFLTNDLRQAGPLSSISALARVPVVVGAFTLSWAGVPGSIDGTARYSSNSAR